MKINFLRPNQSTIISFNHVNHVLRVCMYQYSLDIPHLVVRINIL